MPMDSTNTPIRRLTVTRGFDLVIDHSDAGYRFQLEKETVCLGQLDVSNVDAHLVAGRGFFWFKGNGGLELLSVQREVDVRWDGGIVGRLDKAALQSAMREAASAEA